MIDPKLEALFAQPETAPTVSEAEAVKRYLGDGAFFTSRQSIPSSKSRVERELRFRS